MVACSRAAEEEEEQKTPGGVSLSAFARGPFEQDGTMFTAAWGKILLLLVLRRALPPFQMAPGPGFRQGCYPRVRACRSSTTAGGRAVVVNARRFHRPGNKRECLVQEGGRTRGGIVGLYGWMLGDDVVFCGANHTQRRYVGIVRVDALAL